MVIPAVLLMIVATTLAVPGVAQDYRNPPRAWFSGFGQGTVEAAVRNDAGAELRFSCPAGAEDIPPSISLSLPSGGPTSSAEHMNAVFEVDGVSHEWAFDRTASNGKEVEYGFEAFNDRVASDQRALAQALRVGRRLTVYVPADRVMQAFSLTGSSAALDGCASVE